MITTLNPTFVPAKTTKDVFPIAAKGSRLTVGALLSIGLVCKLGVSEMSEDWGFVVVDMSESSKLCMSKSRKIGV